MEEKNITVVEPAKAPTEVAEQKEQRQTLAVADMWNNTEAFGNVYRMAQTLAKSDLVPQAYKGNAGNCLIAIDVANRMGLSPMNVMQYSQVVYGNFTWKGTACKSMIDASGLYKKTRYVEVGERGKDNWGFYLRAMDKDGEIVNGVAVTIGMAKSEGWYGKNGSKWQTMPELMLKYRAAAFFMRTECAGLAMGYLTAEEVEDIGVDNTTTKPNINDLLAGDDDQ